MKKWIENALLEAEKVHNDFFNEHNVEKIEQISKVLTVAFKNKQKVIICGNGGSNCDAMHFAEEFTGKYRTDRPPLPVISLSDPSHITCVGNDYGFPEIFARGVSAYGSADDVFIGISTSGNSENVLKAVSRANTLGMTTVGLLGRDGGLIKKACEHCLIVEAQTTDRIQEMHIRILHIIIEMVERALFPENYQA